MGGNTTTNKSEKKQCVWIVRYGLTKYNLENGVGPFDSKLLWWGVGSVVMPYFVYVWWLTVYFFVVMALSFTGELDMNEGMEHAKRIAYKIRRSGVDKPKVVYCSPFLRTAHTAQLIALDLPNPTVRVEEGLTEWQIPSLLEDVQGQRVFPKETMEVSTEFLAFLSYVQTNPFSQFSCLVSVQTFRKHTCT